MTFHISSCRTSRCGLLFVGFSAVLGCSSTKNPDAGAAGSPTGASGSSASGASSTGGSVATGGTATGASGASGSGVGGASGSGGTNGSAGGVGTAGAGGASGGAGSSSGGTAGTSGSSGAGGRAGGGGNGGGAAGSPGIAGNGSYIRTGWVAMSTPLPAVVGMRTPPSSESLSPQNVFDGQLNTRWGTGVYQVGGEIFILDMQRPVTFSRITLDPGSADENDYPGRSDVYVSNDVANFGTAVVVGHVGRGGLDTITMPSAQTGRFVKIVNTMIVDATHWWAIGELNVYP